jgi:hypothetical protein
MTRRVWWWLGALVLAAGLGLVAWSVWPSRDRAGDSAQLPADDELRRLVRTRAKELGELRELIETEPRLTIIGDDRVEGCWRDRSGRWGCPDEKNLDESTMIDHVGLSRERWSRYRALLGAVGGHRVEREAAGRVRVMIFSAGIVTSGTGKDLVWSAAPPAPLVPDTDRDRSAHYTVNYADAGDGWYIEHSSN